MSEPESNWDELLDLLRAYDQAEDRLRFAVATLQSSGGDSGRLFEDARRLVTRGDPLASASHSTAESEALAAFEAANLSFWKTRMWLAAEDVIVVPRGAVDQAGPAVKKALARVREESEPYVEYEMPEIDSHGHRFIGGLPEWLGRIMNYPPAWHEVLLANLADVSGVLVDVDLPDNVVRALGLCRRLYALDEPEATIALCRSAAEAVVHDWLSTNGHSVTQSIDWAREAPLLEWLRPDLKTSLREVGQVRFAANQVIHPAKPLTAAEGGAYEALRITFRFTERVYKGPPAATSAPT